MKFAGPIGGPLGGPLGTGPQLGVPLGVPNLECRDPCKRKNNCFDTKRKSGTPKGLEDVKVTFPRLRIDPSIAVVETIPGFYRVFSS